VRAGPGPAQARGDGARQRNAKPTCSRGIYNISHYALLKSVLFGNVYSHSLRYQTMNYSNIERIATQTLVYVYVWGWVCVLRGMAGGKWMVGEVGW